MAEYPAVVETPSAMRLQANSILAADTVLLAGVKKDGSNRIGHMSDASRRIRAPRAPANKPGAMRWLLGGAASTISESWAVPVDLMRVRRVGEERGQMGGGSGGGDEVSELGGDEVAAEGTPAR
jgi:hypothetical protein